jgi:hypothetical protein
MITLQTESLEEINTLIESRKELREKDKDLRLEEVNINGYIRLDSTGNIWYADEREEVQTMRLVQTIVPKPLMTCNLCHEKWNVHNLRNHAYHYIDGHVHKNCLQISEGKRELGSFLVAFHEAGLLPFRIDQLENNYWPDAYKNEYYYTPWYSIQTTKAEFEVGWRKRVIVLTLKGKPEVDFEELFADCEVTKEKDMIHAWGTQALTRYLKRITERLDQNPSRYTKRIKELDN